MKEMTASEFCRRVQQCVEGTLEPLHIKLVIHTPRRLVTGPAGFCHIAVDAYVDLQGIKGKRQFATLTISPVRSEITGGVMVNSHSISLIKQVIKEYASYIKMHMDATVEKVRDASRILAEIQS
jgi:hypothetical protein